MNHRKTMGFAADAADSAALTVADPRATERIIEACDWKSIHKKEKNRIDNALRRLDNSDRAFARAILSGKSWRDMSIPKSTFSVRLKKLKNLFHVHKLRVKCIMTRRFKDKFIERTPHFAHCI